MINNNHFEKSNFRILIEKDNIGHMEERLNIVDTFLDTEEHVTVEDMMQLLKKAGYDYQPDFVRQCLNRFVEHGFEILEHRLDVTGYCSECRQRAAESGDQS
jgi:Fur family ferric uptake transcriptional regulator